MIQNHVTVKATNGDIFEGFTVAKSKKGYYSMCLRGGGIANIPLDEIEGEPVIGSVVSMMEFDKPTTEVSKMSKKAEVKVKANTTATAGVTVKGPSKAERAMELLKDIVTTAPRKECIEILMKELEMSPAGASTYHANIKKKVAELSSKEGAL